MPSPTRSTCVVLPMPPVTAVEDLAGARSRLSYLAELGLDAVWLNPFYPSPGRDHCYDVADYCGVDAKLGTLEEFDRLIADAHELGLGCSSTPKIRGALFAPVYSGQPDLNWHNREGYAEFEAILRFWLYRGAAGLRIDAARGLYKRGDLADELPGRTPGDPGKSPR